MAGVGRSKGPEKGLLNTGRAIERQKSAGSRNSMALYPTQTEGKTLRAQTLSHERRSSSPQPRMSVLTDPTIKTRVSDLLDNCRYSGWVKKQGGKHRNCEFPDVYNAILFFLYSYHRPPCFCDTT